MKTRILVIGPSAHDSKGGMATVIEEIQEDRKLNKTFKLDVYPSYRDGNKILVLFYSFFAYCFFYFTKRNYDIYHIHMASRGSTFRKGYYVKAAKRWGKKVILHIHGAQYMEFYHALPIKKRKKVIELLKSADCVIALSKEWKKKFDDEFRLTNCLVIENGINMNRLKSAQNSTSYHNHTFLALGRLGKRKGSYDLVQAAEIVSKEVKDLKVLMAGDGETQEIQRLIEKKNLQNYVKVLGWADFQTKLNLLKECATVVLPSYNEGLPMAILEGMAAGKAVISTYVGAIPEVIKEENGFLIEAGDINALAEAMIRCSTDGQKLEEISRNNVKKIQDQFSMEIMHKKLEKIYESVL